MRLFLGLIFIGLISWQLWPSKRVATNHENTQATHQITQNDRIAFNNHLQTLGPKLQSMPAGIHSFTAPSSQSFRYKITKSGKYYCPRRGHTIYRNISIQPMD